MSTVTTASAANQNLQRKQYSRFSIFGKRRASNKKEDFENLEQISELLKGNLGTRVYIFKRFIFRFT